MFDNIKNMLQQAGQIQEQFKAMNEELSQEKVTGKGAAGLVSIDFNCKRKAQAIRIDQELWQEDHEVLEELILAAINDGMKQVDEKKAHLVKQLAQKNNIPENMMPF